jgi:hypothetical protein
MTMEGNPHEAASGIFNARERLYDAMLDLMGQGDLPAAYEAVLDAQGSLDAVRTELNSLARVNGIGSVLDALEDRGEADPAPPRAVNGRCPDHVPCISHCGSGQCSRCCTVCRRLAGAPTVPCPACPDRGEIDIAEGLDSRRFTDPRQINHGGRTIGEQEDVSDGLRCPACLSPDPAIHGGVPASGNTAVQCTHIWHTPLPPPDPDRKPARTLLANPSLAGWIPADDLVVELMPLPALAPGMMHTGRLDRGVRATHKPTGTVAESSGERSQLQNKSLAIARLRAHPNVARYIVNQRCTHGSDCTAHPGSGGLHNYDGLGAGALPVHEPPRNRKDPR